VRGDCRGGGGGKMFGCCDRGGEEIGDCRGAELKLVVLRGLV
jgi:hypothetical protein